MRLYELAKMDGTLYRPPGHLYIYHANAQLNPSILRPPRETGCVITGHRESRPVISCRGTFGAVSGACTDYMGRTVLEDIGVVLKADLALATLE